MLYIINSIRLIKPVNNEVGHDDNKVGRGVTDYVFALKTDWRFLSYVAACLNSRIPDLQAAFIH